MKRTRLFACFLLAALVLTGCGVYPPAVQPGGGEGPAVSGTVGAASVPGEVAPAPGKPDAPPASTRLTRAQAEAIALKHAGVTAGQVNGLRSEADFDNGIAHYDVDFRVGQWEYEYEIHAETGVVLSFEKDD